MVASLQHGVIGVSVGLCFTGGVKVLGCFVVKVDGGILLWIKSTVKESLNKVWIKLANTLSLSSIYQQ